MSALYTLLHASIDYAGLFPPAGLGMEPAVANYASYRASPHAWALGRFVVPAGRLPEFEAAAGPHLPRDPSSSPWRIAALLGSDPAADLRALGEFNCSHAAAGAGTASADVIEAKADSVEGVERVLALVPSYLQAYIEIPLSRDPAAMVAAIAAAGARAKARTGGITTDAFPPSADVTRFIRACLTAGVSFKATAGLHHPLRADYRLTYEPDSACGTMFGFLNVFLATAFMAAGLEDAVATQLLEEQDPASIRFDETGVEWRGRRLRLEEIHGARESGIISFGSCSFTEPVADLQHLGLL